MRRIPYATQWIEEDDIASVSDALRSSYLTQGPLVEKLERKAADYCGAKYAVAINSGTSALHAACFAAGIGLGNNVITSPITFVASANCILYCSGKPIFADILEDSINIDPFEIEKCINHQTKAVIPVHYAGHPCEMKEIFAVAKKNKLIVIEDAAHALGAEYNGSKIGSCRYSDMTILSFHAVKNITTGEGGMVLTNNREYYERLLMFRSHGITKNAALLSNKNKGKWYYEMKILGYNYRITDFQCALGIRQMDKLEKFINRRREIAEKYTRAFDKNDLIVVPYEKEGVKSSWHIYAIQLKRKRKKVFDALRKKSIGVNVHYIPIYFHPFYKGLGYKKGICPRAEAYYEKTLTLPLFPKMSDDDVEYVIKSVLSSIEG